MPIQIWKKKGDSDKPQHGGIVWSLLSAAANSGLEEQIHQQVYSSQHALEGRCDTTQHLCKVGEPSQSIIICHLIFFSGYNLGIDLIDPLVIRHEQRSYETGNFFQDIIIQLYFLLPGVYIMPLLQTWNDQNEVLFNKVLKKETYYLYPKSPI